MVDQFDFLNMYLITLTQTKFTFNGNIFFFTYFEPTQFENYIKHITDKFLRYVFKKKLSSLIWLYL